MNFRIQFDKELETGPLLKPHQLERIRTHIATLKERGALKEAAIYEEVLGRAEAPENFSPDVHPSGFAWQAGAMDDNPSHGSAFRAGWHWAMRAFGVSFENAEVPTTDV